MNQEKQVGKADMKLYPANAIDFEACGTVIETGNALCPD